MRNFVVSHVSLFTRLLVRCACVNLLLNMIEEKQKNNDLIEDG